MKGILLFHPYIELTMLTRFRVLAVALVALITACAGEKATGPAPVAAITVSPASLSLRAGEAQTVSASLVDAKGATLTGRAVTWSVASTTVAQVSASGEVTAIATGQTTVLASAEGRSGTMALTVLPAPVATVSLDPVSRTLYPSQTAALTAVMKDARGNVVSDRALSWTSSAPAVATVSAQGAVTAVALGTTTVTVTSEGKAATAAITVVPVPVASLAVTPTTVSLSLTQTQQLTAVAKDSVGNALTGRLVTWTSSAPSVATVSAQGVVTALAPGQTMVAAAVEGKAATGTITVLAPPRLTLSINAPKVFVGETTVLQWSATNATSCAASGAWSGSQAISGTSTQTPATSGALTYTLTCTGAGGTATQSVALTVPIRVEKSSYENKAVAGEVLGAQILPDGVFAINGLAFADFFQDGSYSMVTHSNEYWRFGVKTPGKLGYIHFWRNVSGRWVDNTTKILTSNVGCLHPRKASVADFNNDKKPDVFIACHGFDAPPFPGESSIILLSQPDDSYKSSFAPVTCFCHGASTADVNGDEYADVLVTDLGQPFFLINNKNGTFTRDRTRLPADIRNPATAEMIDFARVGKYDVFLGGHEQDENSKMLATIFPNNGTGNFGTTSRWILPSLQGFGLALDIVYKSGTIYLLRTIDTATNFYGRDAIQKIAYPSLASASLYQHSGKYYSGNSFIGWIIWWQGRIVSLDSKDGVSIPQ